MIGSGRLAFAVTATVVFITGLSVAALMLIGEDLGSLWREIRTPLLVLVGGFALVAVVLAATVCARIANRLRRPMVRYQLVVSQADEAIFDEVAAALEQLVQTVREAMVERFMAGQPWLAIESWFVPAEQPGETGTAAVMLLCQPHRRESAMAALRRAYPDLTLRPDPKSADGAPLEFVRPSFVPGHVLRVHKTRSWAHPISAGGHRHESSNARSTMADIIRQQQQAQRVSCVRWCILPAADQLDSRAAEKLARLARVPNAAHSGDIQQSLQSAGGAMSYLELQAAVVRREVTARRGQKRPESFSELQNLCRDLLAPALSQRGSNHLSERLMIFRQGLYQRRWARGEPPLLPSPGGKTLFSPRELALLMELPSLGSEHALPLQRNTVPHLPIPTEAPRGTLQMPAPPLEQADQDAVRQTLVAEGEEPIDAELVVEEEPTR